MFGAAGDIDLGVSDQAGERATDKGPRVTRRRDVGIIEHGVAVSAQLAVMAGFGRRTVFIWSAITISLAVIGSVIAEFVGATQGLGYVIQQSGASADTALAFAAITLLSIMSIVLFYGLVLLEHLLLPWAQETR